MAEPLYEVTFVQPGEGPITLRVREIADSGLGPMFVRLGNFQFGSSNLVIDPVQDNLRARYEKTKSLHVNRMSIISVEEIEGPRVELSHDGHNVVMLRPPQE